jgi:hypothetical protein
MAVIRAAHYGETEARLMEDPIVIAMAMGLADVPRKELAHDGGETPRFEFTQSANAEYRARGGQDGGHIGAVSAALLKLLAPPTKVVKFHVSRRSLSAWRDEDVAMSHVDIYSGDDEDEAKKALINYIVNDEAAPLAKYGDGGNDHWAVRRMAALFDVVQQVMLGAKFAGGQSREALDYEAEGIGFSIVRSERDAK